MAGEHILKLLVDENARIGLSNRWLICSNTVRFPTYCVYERKPYQRKTRALIVTEDEQLACRFLKGE